MITQDFDIATIGARTPVPLHAAAATSPAAPPGVWIQNYAQPDVRKLARLSRASAAGFSDICLIRRRADRR